MKKILLFTLLISLVLSSSVSALSDSSEIPPLLKIGFDKYKKEGPKAAIEAWAKGSAAEGSKEALSQANNFRQVQDFYGKYIGYSLVKANQISGTTSVYLIDIAFEFGNVFSVFYCYQKDNGQLIVTTFRFHTEAEQVWPASIVFGQSK